MWIEWVGMVPFIVTTAEPGCLEREVFIAHTAVVWLEGLARLSLCEARSRDSSPPILCFSPPGTS